MKKRSVTKTVESDYCLSIKTSGGDLNVFETTDSDYPAVYIDINDTQIACVEYEYESETYRGFLWDGAQEDYRHKVVIPDTYESETTGRLSGKPILERTLGQLGVIRLFENTNPDYPGIFIDVNDTQIALVDYDLNEEVFKGRLWDGFQEDYVHIVEVNPGEKERLKNG